MTEQALWIPGRFPGANEAIAAAKAGRGKSNGYGRLKASESERVMRAAKDANLLPVARARLGFLWVEPDRRRDPDNVVFATKFVLDGLVNAGILPDDGWDEVEAFSHAWGVGKEPGVRVSIREVAPP